MSDYIDPVNESLGEYRYQANRANANTAKQRKKIQATKKADAASLATKKSDPVNKTPVTTEAKNNDIKEAPLTQIKVDVPPLRAGDGSKLFSKFFEVGQVEAFKHAYSSQNDG